MKFLDYLLGPRCIDCEIRIKGEKIAVPEKGFLCRSCKNEREAKEKRIREEADRKCIDKARRDEAERKARKEARYAKYFDHMDNVLSNTPSDAQSSLSPRSLSVLVTEMRDQTDVQPDSRIGRAMVKLQMTGKIDEEAFDHFLLTMLFEHHIKNIIAEMPPMSAIPLGEIGREFVALFFTATLVNIMVKDDSGERMQKLLKVFGLVGRELQQSGPFHLKSTVFKEAAAMPKELIDPIFEVMESGTTEPSASQLEAQSVAVNHYLAYFAHHPQFSTIASDIEPSELAKSAILFAKEISNSVEARTEPILASGATSGVSPKPKPSPEEFGEIASSEGWKLRQQILKSSPLRKCCEIQASAPAEGSDAMEQIMRDVMKKSGAPESTCERLVLYRLDGQSLSEAETYKHAVEFVGAKGKTDGQYLSLFLKFVSAGYDSKNEACRATPVPISAFSIKLDGDKQEVIAKCEVLATTEFMGPDADFMTRGSGFTEDGVSYRVYSYWKQ